MYLRSISAHPLFWYSITPTTNCLSASVNDCQASNEVASSNLFSGYFFLNSKNKSDKKAAEKVSIFWPNQETNGTHVNISGAGIVKGSKNLYNAIKFLEFLSTKESQEIYTKKMHEYSIREDVYPSTTVSSFGTFIVDDLELDKLSSKIKQPIYLASKKKWR